MLLANHAWPRLEARAYIRRRRNRNHSRRQGRRIGSCGEREDIPILPQAGMNTDSSVKGALDLAPEQLDSCANYRDS